MLARDNGARTVEKFVSTSVRRRPPRESKFSRRRTRRVSRNKFNNISVPPVIAFYFRDSAQPIEEGKFLNLSIGKKMCVKYSFRAHWNRICRETRVRSRRLLRYNFAPQCRLLAFV